MPHQAYDLRAYPLFRSLIDDGKNAAKAKRCLVIDPSHDPCASVRQHAETLWKYVIQPALLDSPYSPRRADRTQENAPTDQAAIDAVLDDDLIIAVPSFGNARVFYEIALAQAAARPLILMIEEGQELGFDPRNAEVVTYRLDAESVVSAFNVARLQTVICEIEDRGRPASHGFRPGVAALNGGCENSITVFERSPKFSYDRRLDMMRSARARIDVMGVANLALTLQEDIVDVVRGCADRGVDIRILQCSPANPGLSALIGARNFEHLDAAKERISAATGAWRKIAEAVGGGLSLTVRRAQTSLPMANALLTEQSVVATPYLHSRTTAESPTLFARAEDAYHNTMREEFSVLWAEATTAYRCEPEAPRIHDRALEDRLSPLFRLARKQIAADRNTDARGFAIIRSVAKS